MIESLKLVNFRNFSEKNLEKFSEKNFIIGENGKGKTNILEAIAILCNSSILNVSLDDLVKIGQDYFFIEIKDPSVGKLGFYYSKKDKKKNYSINGKKVSKKIFFEKTNRSVIFSPIFMNLMYLSPNLRRDFLDEILKNSYSDFDKIKKDYKKILKSRNSTLKAIFDNKAEEKELDFWDNKFVETCYKYYIYRLKIIIFFKKHIKNIEKFFSKKIKNIEFEYKTKIIENEIEKSIRDYLNKNRKRDIIIGKTTIGPHLDDFFIKINEKNINSIASRGEIKSSILYLKLLEGIFLEKNNGKKPILIIDDLLSELDKEHKNSFLENLSYYQTFISNIEAGKEKIYIKL